MNFIEHIHEPLRLVLVWQSAEPPRTRRAVAEIVRPDESTDHAIFRYLVDTSDMRLAQAEGFVGFPAFPKFDAEYEAGVVDVFNRRLPPRERGDYARYLEQFRLRPSEPISSVGLLAYTGAKLPSDGFALIDPLEDIESPVDVLIEVAGYRHHQQGCTTTLAEGMPAELRPEPDNAFDPNAIAIYVEGDRIGYVPRQQAPALLDLLRRGDIASNVERINGQPERPLIYLFASIRPRPRGIFAPRREFVPASI